MTALTQEQFLKEIDKLRTEIALVHKEVLTASECAVYIGVSLSQIYKLTQRGVPFYKPIGRKIYFKRKEIEAWILSNKKMNKI